MKKTFYSLFFTLCLLSLPLFATDTEKLPSGIARTEIAERIDSYVAENEKTNAGLSLAVFAGDDILYEGYHGYADKENGIAVDKNTVMEWGSSTKILVWVSVMQLVEKGELSLSKDIVEYLPEDFFTKLKYDTPLTMYNLMHHTAGWQEVPLELFVTNEKNISDLETTLRKTEPQQVFEPGEFTAYSNWGVALAGYIVECITGQPFYEYVHENIFDVLGMEHTAFNADISDNAWVKEQRNSLKYYSALGEELAIPYLYIPLYPAGSATGTLSDFLRFAMALIPDATGKSPLFQSAQTLQDFFETSLYYVDGKTARNSHGLWAGFYAVPTIGHAGNTAGCSANLLISPSAGVGVVVMANQSSEGIYNYKMMPLIFGEYDAISTNNMSDVAKMEGMYLNSRTTFSGMLKWYKLMAVMPFVKSAENMLSSPLSAQIIAKQIEPYTYSLSMGDMVLMLEASISDTKTMMSAFAMDYVKINQGSVVFWIATLILFVVAAIYAIIALICILVRCIRHKAPQVFGKLRLLNNTSILLCFVNLCILVVSVASYWGTYTSVFIQGLFFIIFALIPVVFTVLWIVGYKKQKVDKKQRKWLIISSVAGLIMTFNVIFWDLYMIW